MSIERKHSWIYPILPKMGWSTTPTPQRQKNSTRKIKMNKNVTQMSSQTIQERRLSTSGTDLTS